MEVVGEAANGLEAIQENERLHPDLIILDVSMPVVDGLTAAAVSYTHLSFRSANSAWSISATSPGTTSTIWRAPET